MSNVSLKKNPMPEQEAQVRNKNYSEVALGYTKELAIAEAQRCIGCKNKPCVEGCPVLVQIPEFISKVAEGNFEEAYKIIISTNSLPAVCGRVCPQETQCEIKCVLGNKGEPVAIGRLERFVADYYLKNHANAKAIKTPKPNGRKVAIIGSGPAGLSCAGDLAKLGYEITIFEALHKPGGVLVYGIPEFRLPNEIVQSEIDNLTAMGVKLVTNAVIGMAVSIDDLLAEGYDAVFIGSGAGLPMFMNIPGENLLGVYSSNEYLTRINLMKAYLPRYDTKVKKAKKVAVIGGGNVAMDAARCAKRMGAEEVYIIYRRSMEELPARIEEVHHAKAEGIIFKLLTTPVAVLGNDDGHARGIECVQMELGEPDASGRRRPIAIKDSNFDIDVDAVIVAIGTNPNPLIASTTDGLDTNKWGGIITDKSGATSRKGVFAGGDAVTGAATVIEAMGAGKTAAEAIDRYIQGNAP